MSLKRQSLVIVSLAEREQSMNIINRKAKHKEVRPILFDNHDTLIKQQAISFSKMMTAIIISSLLFLIIAPSAFAEDATRTFTWQDGQSQPSIPNTITGSNGQEMTLASTSSPTRSGSGGTVSQAFSQSRDYTVPADSDVASSVPRALDINDNGYSGSIPRTSLDYTPIYRTDSQSQTITNDMTTSSDDTSSLPQTITRDGRVYQLLGATFDPGMQDSAGNVYTWTAHATYETTIDSQVLDHYNVVAYYNGTLTKPAADGEWSVTATYHSDDNPANSLNENETAGVTATYEDTDGFGNPINPNQNEETDANAANPFDGSMNASNGNTTSSQNEQSNWIQIAPPAQKEDNDNSILPLLLILLLVAIALIALFLIKHRKRTQDSISAPTSVPLPEKPNNLVTQPTCQLVLITSPSTDDTPDASDTTDSSSPSYSQVMADLEMVLSVREDIPNIVFFPPIDDVHSQLPSDDSCQYWIIMDETVKNAPSKDIIVSTDDYKKITEGKLEDESGNVTDRIQIDINTVYDAFENQEDISNRLQEYENLRQQVINEQAQQADFVPIPADSTFMNPTVTSSDETVMLPISDDNAEVDNDNENIIDDNLSKTEFDNDSENPEITDDIDDILDDTDIFPEDSDDLYELDDLDDLENTVNDKPAESSALDYGEETSDDDIDDILDLDDLDDSNNDLLKEGNNTSPDTIKEALLEEEEKQENDFDDLEDMLGSDSELDSELESSESHNDDQSESKQDNDNKKLDIDDFQNLLDEIDK